MAHEINKMAYAGAIPWHGLGTALPRNATPEEVWSLAGFYDAKAIPLHGNAGGVPFMVDDRKAIIRGDKVGAEAYLATMGADYQIVQFSELAEAVVTGARGEQAIIHTAGTLGEKGERGWILAELPERYVIRVKGDDSEIRPYLLAATSHDGSLAAHLRNVATRVVCQNTLGAALGERGGASWTIRHTSGAAGRLQDAAEAFRLMGSRMERFGQLANALAERSLTSEDFERAVAVAVPIPDDGEAHKELQERREEMRGLRETFKGVTPAIVGTAWGDVQAITEALDWHGRAAGMDAARQAEFSALGSGAALKSKALDVLVRAAGLNLASVVHGAK